MTIRDKSRSDLEWQKFVTDSSGNVAVNVLSFDEVANSLVPSQYDYISLGYSGSDLTSVIYKMGGSDGTTVSTLTLAYSGSNLISVSKS